MSELYDFNSKPTSLWLTVNRSCNFRCKWCYAECSGFKAEDEMSLSLAKEIVNLAHNAGIKHITAIGGEPTLWEPLFELNDYCKKLPIKIGMVTNACMFGDDSYWQKFLESPFESMGISIKGITEQQFENTVGTKTLYQKTLVGLERLLRYYPDRGVSVVYSNLVSPEEIEEIAITAHKMGAKSFQLSSCSVTLDDNDGFSDAYSAQIEQFVDGLMEVYPRLTEIYSGRVLIEPRLPLCVFPVDFLKTLMRNKQLLNLCHVQNRSGLVFDTGGSLLPCNSMVGIKIGKYGKDFTTSEELLTFLNNPELKNNYKEMLRYPSDECVRCELNNLCRGGCIQNWLVLDPKVCRAIN